MAAKVSMYCPGGNPEFGEYHGHVKKRRVVVGWNHNIDTDEGFKHGKVWCWVSEHGNFQVYDQQFNRGAQGRSRFCGVANFTMIRMFHPYFCYGDPEARDRMSVPQDGVSEDKRMCRNRYRDLVRRHPGLFPGDDDEEDEEQPPPPDNGSRSSNSCITSSSDSDSASDADDDHGGEQSSSLNHQALLNSNRSCRHFSSVSSLNFSSNRNPDFSGRNSMDRDMDIDGANEADEDKDESNDNIQRPSTLDQISASDPFYRLPRHRTTVTRQPRRRRNREDSESDDTGGRSTGNLGQRTRLGNIRRSSTPKRRRLFNRVRNTIDLTSLESNPGRPRSSLQPFSSTDDEGSKPQIPGRLRDAFVRMGSLSPPPFSPLEFSPVGYSAGVNDSLLIPETVVEGTDRETAITIKDEEGSDVVPGLKKEGTRSWTVLKEHWMGGNGKDNPIEII